MSANTAHVDREHWTAHNVGPLDVDMLQQQLDTLAAIRRAMEQDNAAGATDEQWGPDDFDAIDGMTHLAGHLLDLFEQGAGETMIPLREVAAAIGLPDADEEGILPGSAADQCAGIYALLDRYGIEVR